jgi:hypothetical protein
MAQKAMSKALKEKAGFKVSNFENPEEDFSMKSTQVK